VKALHDADLEVILDVVFNHTPEGEATGPTISFRGIDNAMYYRLTEPDRSHYENLTGCGNTVNIAHPRVTQFVLDSLRYWVQCMGVDGFRFDLAPVLGRTAHGFDPHAAFFAALAQDPVLANVKLIAEPWDIGPGGYQLGHFPGRFMEWNDKFRDTTRRFWLHDGMTRGEFARRFMASSDVFHRGHRRPSASVNYVCAHDGYTLRDVVSYARKHNLENGESNRDGRNGEISFNHGAEGFSADANINQARQAAVRALLASLILSQGTPILRGGDELGQTQRGNNNAYCQDNEISWIDWATADHDLVQYTARLIALRKQHAVLHQDTWFTGRAAHGNTPDLQWFGSDGCLMSIEAWQDASAHAFAVLMRGSDAHAPAIFLTFNGATQPVRFTLPEGLWQLEIDSADQLHEANNAREHINIAARAIAVLRQLSP
ncbi:MAG: glycogen debranching protein, partial [Burkholderiaceae bacterium]